MYARVIALHARPGIGTDQAMEVYHDIRRELEQKDGFRGSTFMINEETQRAIAVTFWRDQACAGEAGQETLPMLIARIHGLVDVPPDVSGYEVIDHALLPTAVDDDAALA